MQVMNATINRECSLVDEFENTLYREGATGALHRVVWDLAAMRASMSAEAWRIWCKANPIHDALPLLTQDPYTRDARSKPAGYAGDARTLDYVYLQDPGMQPVTALGRNLFKAATGIALSAAVRLRSVCIAQHLEELIQLRGSASSVSIACGHARELDLM